MDQNQQTTPETPVVTMESMQTAQPTAPTQPEKPQAVAPWLLIILIVVVLAGIGFFGWNYLQSKKVETVTPVATAPVVTPKVSVKVTPSVSPSVVSTADWKTYENKDLGFSLKYPADFLINASKGEIADYLVKLNSAKTSVDIRVTGQIDKTISSWELSNAKISKTTIDGLNWTVVEDKGNNLIHYFINNGDSGYDIFANNGSLDILESILSTFKFTK